MEEKFASERQKLENNIAKQNQENEELMAANAEQKNTISQLKARLESTESNLESIESQKSQLKALNDELNQQLSSKEEEIQALNQKIRSIEHWSTMQETHIKEMQQKDNRIKEQERLLDEMATKLDSIQSQLAFATTVRRILKIYMLNTFRIVDLC
jgi:chromosome segregation ATPase